MKAHRSSAANTPAYSANRHCAIFNECASIKQNVRRALAPGLFHYMWQ
jgi:hypothetical protein